MAGPDRGPVNGADRGEPAGAARTLAVPVSATQRTKLPALQAFLTAAKLAPPKDQPRIARVGPPRIGERGSAPVIAAYRLDFAIQTGADGSGTQLTLVLTPGMPARAIAAYLRQAAAQLDALADAAEAELEPAPNTSTAAKGPDPAPARSCPRSAGSPAPSSPCGWDEAARRCSSAGCPLAPTA